MGAPLIATGTQEFEDDEEVHDRDREIDVDSGNVFEGLSKESKGSLLC